MNKGPTSSWQDLPTVVELTEQGVRKAETGRRIAEMLDDTPDGARGEPASITTVNTGGWSVEDLVRDFRFGGDVPTIVASAAPLINLAHTLRQTEQQPDIEQLRRTSNGRNRPV